MKMDIQVELKKHKDEDWIQKTKNEYEIWRIVYFSFLLNLLNIIHF